MVSLIAEWLAVFGQPLFEHSRSVWVRLLMCRLRVPPQQQSRTKEVSSGEATVANENVKKGKIDSDAA